MDPPARLDRWLRVGADHEVAGLEQLALPAARIQIEHRPGPLDEVGILRKDPRAVLPGLDRVPREPAPDRRGRRLRDAALDDEPMQLRSTEARQRNALGLGQLARDRLHLGDFLRGENGAGDPTALDPRDPQVPPRRSVFASPRRDRPTCRRARRSRDSCGPRPPAAQAWHEPPPGRPTSGSPPAAPTRYGSRHRARPLLPLVPRHNVRQPGRRSFNPTELAADSTKPGR